MTREFKILGRSKKEQQDICFFNSPLFIIDFSPLAHTPKQGTVVSGDVRYGIVHFKNSRENEYELWAQWFLGSFRWRSVSYDWWMVFKATINQSTSKPKQSQKSLPARTLVRILLRYSFWNEEFWFKRRRDPIRFKISPSRKLPSKKFICLRLKSQHLSKMTSFVLKTH